jgi:hypothetical protein
MTYLDYLRWFITLFATVAAVRYLVAIGTIYAVLMQHEGPVTNNEIIVLRTVTGKLAVVAGIAIAVLILIYA